MLFSMFLLIRKKKNPRKPLIYKDSSSASRRTRTYNPSVNSRMLCHWAIEAKGGYYSTLFGIRRRPTLPGRVQPSTIGADGLNFCVRYGNRWNPFAIATGNGLLLSIRTLTTAQVKDDCVFLTFPYSLRPSSQSRWNQALDLLVSSSSIRYRTSTDDLSPGSLPGVLLL